MKNERAIDTKAVGVMLAAWVIGMASLGLLPDNSSVRAPSHTADVLVPHYDYRGSNRIYQDPTGAYTVHLRDLRPVSTF